MLRRAGSNYSPELCQELDSLAVDARRCQGPVVLQELEETVQHRSGGGRPLCTSQRPLMMLKLMVMMMMMMMMMMMKTMIV